LSARIARDYLRALRAPDIARNAREHFARIARGYFTARNTRDLYIAVQPGRFRGGTPRFSYP